MFFSYLQDFFFTAVVNKKYDYSRLFLYLQLQLIYLFTYKNGQTDNLLIDTQKTR